jgi:hypothetical protein
VARWFIVRYALKIIARANASLKVLVLTACPDYYRETEFSEAVTRTLKKQQKTVSKSRLGNCSKYYFSLDYYFRTLEMPINKIFLFKLMFTRHSICPLKNNKNAK